MKRKIALVLMGVMLIVALAGCGAADSDSEGAAQSQEASTESKDPEKTEASKENAPSEGGVTITLMGNGDDLQRPYIQKLITLWEEETGNTIDVQGLDVSTAKEVALAKFATGDIPDLYYGQAGSSLYNFNLEENFVDYTNAEWVSDVQDFLIPQITYGGKVYGPPFSDSSSSGCFYNKKIFEELGLKPATNQEEFNALCDALLEKGVQPIYMPLGDPWAHFCQFAFDPVMAAHPEYIDKLNANEITYADIPELTSMLKWFQMAAERGWVGKNFATDKWDYNNEVLGTGEAAMMFVWDTYFQTEYDSEAFEYAGDDFGMMPVFMGTCDEGTYEGGNSSMFLVNKNGDKVVVAKDFISFIMKPENYNQAYEGIYASPIFKQMTTTLDSPQYQESKESVDALKRASTTGLIIGYGANTEAILQMMLGDITVEGCIALLDEGRIATVESFAME